QDRVDALGRGHYRRYDERTATELGDQASLLCERWRGDLRRLRDEAGRDGGRIESLLTGLPGIGPAGASIFRREVQVVWPEAGPFVDLKVLAGAARVGLPRQPGALAELAGWPPRWSGWPGTRPRPGRYARRHWPPGKQRQQRGERRTALSSRAACTKACGRLPRSWCWCTSYSSV